MKIVHAKKIDEIVSTIQEWGEKRSKLIVAVDGYSGSGKTSILSEVKARMSFVNVALDDFVYEFPRRKECVDNSNSPEAQFPDCWYRFDELSNLLLAFRDRKKQTTIIRYDFENKVMVRDVIDLEPNILVVEGPFILGKLRHTIDRSIFVLSDLFDADARRDIRERTRWGEQYQSEYHPDSYVRAFKNAFIFYLQCRQPLRNVDLLILN